MSMVLAYVKMLPKHWSATLQCEVLPISNSAKCSFSEHHNKWMEFHETLEVGMSILGDLPLIISGFYRENCGRGNRSASCQFQAPTFQKVAQSCGSYNAGLFYTSLGCTSTTTPQT